MKDRRQSTISLNYDANDRTSTDPYDINGNLLSSGAGTNVYDFENRLVQAGGVKLVYDGDGNRVKETFATATTSYLVADQNLTGYAQVLDEFQNGAVSRTYSYGLTLISQRLAANGQGLSFYGFDGHGSVRFLTDPTGAITDTYDYDAFGNLISHTGSTPNNYLFAGEQFDPALGIYYNRARYYDQRIGRFWMMDSWEGDPQSPPSLHKYLYVGANPVDRADPSGRDWDLGSFSAAVAALGTLASQALVAVQNVAYSIYFNLYRVPQIIDVVSNTLLFLQGTIETAFLAKNAIEQMASDLENVNGKFSAGPSPMGTDVENAGGANLQHNSQSYDYYDPKSQTVIQLKGTRQTSSPEALMGVVRGAINNLDDAPPVVRTFYRDGTPVDIVKSNLRVRAVVVAIPTKPVTWNFQAFTQQIEQLEQVERTIVKIAPSPGLD